MHTNKRSISLQATVALAISGIVAAIAALLIYQGYIGIKNNIFAATEVSAKYASDAVNQSMEKTLLPLELTLRMLRQTPIVTATDMEERLNGLASFSEALTANPITDAVFIAYDTGEFYLLRRHNQNLGKLKLDVPKDTHFILQTKTLQADESFIIEVRYFDSTLNMVGHEQTTAFNIDPRTRSWYQLAQNNDGPITTRAYVFFDTGDIGLSMAQSTENGKAVVGVDTITKDLGALLGSLRMTPSTEIVLVDDSVEVLAYPDTNQLQRQHIAPDGSFSLSSLGVPMFDTLAEKQIEDSGVNIYHDKKSSWLGFVSQLNPYYGNGLKMLIAIPGDELMQEAKAGLLRYTLIAAGTLLFAIACSLYLGHWLVKPLVALTQQIADLGEFNFSAPIGISTRFREVRKLGFVLRDMATTINGLRNISRALNREPNLETMLKTVLQELLALAHRHEGAVYLYSSADVLQLAVAHGEEFMEKIPCKNCKNDDEFINLLERNLGGNYLYVLLKNREQHLIGVLCIDYPLHLRNANSLHFERLTQYIETIAGSAAIAIEMRQLINAHKALLDGMIKLIADAIDTKSHYTGGHCQRVPELAFMIIEKMKESQNAPFDAFSISAQQEEEFRVAAWLHDCGKITTPEYVVDKATKLEAIYNRIHEIRTRFEVLHRDAKISYQASLLKGHDTEEARLLYQEEQNKLQEDFALVAQCNIGGESMSQEAIERIKIIGQRTWLRHFDAQLGLSRNERERCAEEQLPVEEHLLADKPSHVIHWGEGASPPVQKGDPRNIWGFDLVLPPVRYNYGELHNLSITRGTLTAEERFQINDHIVQTIRMLSSLPWPPSLSHVPAIAGNHHETLTGQGYPRKLPASQMGLCERVMAIADVFEALTAPDRPYKDGKTLSQAIGIVCGMVKKGLLDKDIFILFLREGIYLDYAHKNMRPELIDKIDPEYSIASV